jgi:hypothetical protein
VGRPLHNAIIDLLAAERARREKDAKDDHTRTQAKTRIAGWEARPPKPPPRGTH